MSMEVDLYAYTAAIDPEQHARELTSELLYTVCDLPPEVEVLEISIAGYRTLYL